MIQHYLLMTLLALVSWQIGQAAVDTSQMSDLKKEIDGNARNIESLRAKLNDLDGQYWGNQKKLLNTVSVKRNIEMMMETLADRLAGINESVAQQQKKTPQLTQVALLSQLYQETPEAAAVQQLSGEQLVAMVRQLTSQKAELENIQKEYASLNARFMEYVQIEKELAELMGRVTDSKKEIASALYQGRQREKVLSVQLAKGLKRSPALQFNASSSICESNWKPAKNGIEFDLSGKITGCAIRTPRAGKVVYLGNLSTYGDVLIVEHESESAQKLRSIFVGKIETSATKNMLVQAGDQLGIARMAEGSTANLYYELREGKTPLRYTTYMPKAQGTIDVGPRMVEAPGSINKTKI